MSKIYPQNSQINADERQKICVNLWINPYFDIVY